MIYNYKGPSGGGGGGAQTFYPPHTRGRGLNAINTVYLPPHRDVTIVFHVDILCNFGAYCRYRIIELFWKGQGKGQSNEIFDFQFFSSFEPACATDQWFKIFSILIKISLSYSSFYESPRGIILHTHRVYLPRISNPATHLLKFVLKSPWVWYPRGIILRRVNLSG